MSVGPDSWYPGPSTGRSTQPITCSKKGSTWGECYQTTPIQSSNDRLTTQPHCHGLWDEQTAKFVSVGLREVEGMTESQQSGNGPGAPTDVYSRMDSAITALLESIGEKEFYVKIQWPHGDLISNAFQLRADTQTIQIHLGQRSPEDSVSSVLRFFLPTPDTEHDELPDECIQCEYHQALNASCLVLSCYHSQSQTIQQLYAATSLELLLLIVSKCPKE
jgi:hypothetical protein